MAARGRGNANVAVLLGVLLLCTLVAEAAVFNVGDRGGWSFNTNSWPTGKRFKAGDVLGTYLYTCMHGSIVFRMQTDKKFSQTKRIRSFDACESGCLQCSSTTRRRTTWWR